MSSAESLLTMAPSNHSRQWTRKLSPGLTVATGGISGCQRLWPSFAWSSNFLDESSGKMTLGITPPSLSWDLLRGQGQGRGSLRWSGLDVVGVACVRADRGRDPETTCG